MAAPVETLKNKIARVRVSSVLNKDNKQFGKQHLIDGDEETCWNSDQGTSQWVIIDFTEDVLVSEIHIQFQGGFVGKVCSLEKADSGSSSFSKICEIRPIDSNQQQVFTLPVPMQLSVLKIVFEQSTDFFGRITIYNLAILGLNS